MNRLDPSFLKQRLHALNAGAKKSYGQHFLIDGEVLDAVCAVADIKEGERVFEIGPGPGVLTERLLQSGARVTAFEADSDMVRLLHEDFPDLQVVEGDALHTLAYEVGTEPYKVVANIPYQITTPLIKLLLEGAVRPPESLTLLMQKEVGERLVAQPKTGDRGYLSVLTQYYANVRVVYSVPPSAFWPEPSVESVVVHFTVKSGRPIEGSEKEFFHYVKRGFMEPRKQLKNVLAGMRGVETSAVGEQLVQLGLPVNVRAQELSQEDWIMLYKADI